MNTSEGLINVNFSDELNQKQNFNDFISFEPNVTSFKAWATGRTLKISGDFGFNSNYTLSLMKGLRAENGKVLEKEVSANVNFKDLEPALSFTQDGVFLGSGEGRKVYIKTRNIKKVSVEAYQIFANNISEYLRYKNLVSSKNDTSGGFSNPDGFSYVGSKVFDKSIDIQRDKNSWCKRLLI